MCFRVFSFSKLQQSIKNGKKLHKVAMLKLKRINTTQWPKAANVSKEFRRSSLYCIANCDAEMCTKFACKREIIEVSIRIFLLKFSLPVHFIQERKKEEDFFCSVNVNIFMSYLLKKSFEVSSVHVWVHHLFVMSCRVWSAKYTWRTSQLLLRV